MQLAGVVWFELGLERGGSLLGLPGKWCAPVQQHGCAEFLLLVGGMRTAAV